MQPSVLLLEFIVDSSPISQQARRRKQLQAGMSAVLAESFVRDREFIYVRVEEAPSHDR
jgi:hypothetical protein